MNRRTAREKAMQAIFQYDVNEADVHDIIHHVLNEEDGDPFLLDLVNGTIENLDSIDDVIGSHLEKWTIERIGNVDRAILRIAVCEMKWLEDIPINVSINEAIELAKLFGDEESGKFVNAILSKIKATLEK